MQKSENKVKKLKKSFKKKPLTLETVFYIENGMNVDIWYSNRLNFYTGKSVRLRALVKRVIFGIGKKSCFRYASAASHERERPKCFDRLLVVVHQKTNKQL